MHLLLLSLISLITSKQTYHDSLIILQFIYWTALLNLCTCNLRIQIRDQFLSLLIVASTVASCCASSVACRQVDLYNHYHVSIWQILYCFHGFLYLKAFKSRRNLCFGYFTNWSDTSNILECSSITLMNSKINLPEKVLPL